MQPRGYQLEMLDESLRQNIIVAIPTGAGKTLIAALRIQAEIEKAPTGKCVWFLCPKVALAEQQHKAIQAHLPPAYQSILLCGHDGVDHWTSQAVWDRVLAGVFVVVGTYQILAHALESGYVKLSEISLLVFDEAHCCQKKHAANRIMQAFYHPAKRDGAMTPLILGLTASPINSKVDDLKTSRLNEAELLQHVFMPQIINVSYSATPLELAGDLTRQLEALQLRLYQDIHQDPYIVHLKSQITDTYDMQLGSRLEMAVNRGKSWCQEQTKRLITVCRSVAANLGYYSFHFYLKNCIEKLRRNTAALDVPDALREKEILYMSKAFATIQISNKDPEIDDTEIHSPKADQLIDIIHKEMQHGDTGIVFVKERVTVSLLCDILAKHPRTCGVLKIGSFVGSSSHRNRPSHISELIDATGQENTLADLRTGQKNLIIATNVLEEGIDISACNVVICYDRPDNARAFIQRRGRARKARSRLIIFFSAHEEKLLIQWQELEEEMKQKYVDHMRQLEELKRLESEEDQYREYKIESTGGQQKLTGLFRAKLLLTNAVERLYKFCDRIPSNFTFAVGPIFQYQQGSTSAQKSCVVHLPNDLDESLRRHVSHFFWKSERAAKNDAAFEAVVALHKAGLINDHLLPLKKFDQEAAESLRDIESRPGIVEVEELFDIWHYIANEWQKNSVKLYTCLLQSSMQIHALAHEEESVLLVSPLPFPVISSLSLSIDERTDSQVRFVPAQPPERDLDLNIAEQITRLILRAGLGNRVSTNKSDFPILCLPYQSIEDLAAWLDSVSGTVPGTDLLNQYDSQLLEQPARIGVLRDGSKSGIPHMFLDVQMMQMDAHGEVQVKEPMFERVFRVRRFPKRRDFMHSIIANGAKKGREEFLSPENCTVDCLPVSLAYFSLTLPSIFHFLSIHWIAEQLRESLFNEVFKKEDLHLVLTAISSSRAREKSNYQRLEFLGDSLLKTYTTLALLVANPLWPEGYLSMAKDQMVANSRLASIARRLGLDRYILVTPFTGAKWRPYYVHELLNNHQDKAKPTREISTKVLADVVEALLGAAWLAGGEGSLLKSLRVFFPSDTWQSSSESLSELRARARPSDIPESCKAELLELVGYEFQTPSLILQAITMPGSLGIGGLPSYQRLEFLGDALLDMVVTLRLWADRKDIPERWMHRIRTAAVNGPFLAFCALGRQIRATVSKPTPLHQLKDTETNGDTFETLDGAQLESKTIQKSLFSFLRANRSTSLSMDFKRMEARFEHYAPQIIARLVQGEQYPWTELEAMAPKKVVSDLVESTLAAIVIDHGHLSLGLGDEENSPPCRFLRKMGILTWLRTVLSTENPNAPPYDPYMTWHPCEELGFLSQQEKVEYVSWSEKSETKSFGNETPSEVADPVHDPDNSQSSEPSDLNLPLDSSYHCRVLVGARIISEETGFTAAEARVRAAEAAVTVLRQDLMLRKTDIKELEEETEQPGEAVEGMKGAYFEKDRASSNVTMESFAPAVGSLVGLALGDPDDGRMDLDLLEDEVFYDTVMSHD